MLPLIPAMLHDPWLFRLSRADTRPPTVIMWLFCETLGLQKPSESHRQDRLSPAENMEDLESVLFSLSEKSRLNGKG